MVGAWETKDENLISDIRDFSRICEVMLRQMRLHIENGRLLSGAGPETVSFVYMQPAILIYDPARLGPTGDGIPPWVISRVNFRPLKVHVRGSEDDIARLPAILAWQRKQFRDIGYLVLILPTVDLKNVPQGRRQLDLAEKKVRDALELWTFALMPEIERLFRATEDVRERTSAERYDSLEQFLAAAAPDILRAAQRSVAGRKDELSSQEVGVVYAYLNALQDEGRKHRISFRGDANPGPLHGDALRARIRRPGTRNDGSDKIPALSRLSNYIDILNTLAKARMIVTEVMSKRVSDMNDYQWGMDRVEEDGVHKILSNEDQHSKRTRNAAAKVLASQTSHGFVQPPNLSDLRKFNLMQLATIAFLCDVDPYVFCAQHALRFLEVWVARAWGRFYFQGREPAGYERDLGDLLDSGAMVVPDCAIGAHGHPSTERVFKDLRWILRLMDVKPDQAL